MSINNHKKHILVVDDEEDILALLEHNLSKEGFKVTCASTGEDALELARTLQPDLILLDIMLPGMNGLEVMKCLENEGITGNTSVLFVSARSDDIDVVLGLELGACDYVTKPFSVKVLISRLKVILRNQKNTIKKRTGIVRVRDLVIYSGQRKVTLNGKQLNLTQAEFSIIELLAEKPGWVFSRAQIIEAIYDDDHNVTDRSIDVQIYGLRKKMGQGKDYIETIRSAGYRIVD